MLFVKEVLNMNFETAALAYVRHVLSECRLSARGLAIAAGISPSTLTRALNDPKHKFTLSMKTIEKIAQYSGINPALAALPTTSLGRWSGRLTGL
jgi:hypothetical protein